MKVLIFHGYLLRGTGSNIYNASLAPALARLGHEVHLLCQDRTAGELEWVNRRGTWKGGRLAVEDLRAPGGEGSVTAYVPEIGGLLPVFVADRYEGFEARTFSELSAAQLDRYLEANVAAVADVVEAAEGIGAALANHLVMGPLILARAGLRFAVKVHGSDLSYTVIPDRRFVAPAREGAEAASGLLVGSRHTAEDLWGALRAPELAAKTRLGPPGVDTDRFRPLPREAAVAQVRDLAFALGRSAAEAAPRDLGQGAWDRDPGEAAEALERWMDGGGPRVMFVGKLIVSKGVDLLLAGWPLVHREHPGARLLIAGFGAYRTALERLWRALERGELEEPRRIAAAGRALEAAGDRGSGGEAPPPLGHLSAFLADPPVGYEAAGRDAAGSVAFCGRLEHDEVAAAIPATDVLAMPSTFPEAFGMVAAEAAACGAGTVSADHSGMREVARRLAEAVPGHAELLSFPVDDGAVAALAARLHGWLAMPAAERRAVGAALAARVEELWSWEGVARGVIAASQGRLDDLPPVPE